MDFKDKLFDTDKYAFRVSQEYEGETKWTQSFATLLEQPEAANLEALVIGVWSDELFDNEGSSQPAIEALVAGKDTLTNLKAIFLGDIVGEECEVSWIHQSDVSPIFHAYPNLEIFAVRGSDGLQFGNISHAKLRHLTVQSGGLDASIVRDILASEFPNLEHLDLYLGTDNYGANTAVDDLAPLFRGELFPKLTYLGLRNSDLTDALAGVLVNAPILASLKTLDLSLGTLSDEGAKIFSSSEKLGSLEKLDIHYHFVTEEALKELKAHLRKLKIKIDAADAQDANDDWRSPQIGE